MACTLERMLTSKQLLEVSFANEIIMDAPIFYREIACQIQIQLPTINIALCQCDTSSDKPNKNVVLNKFCRFQNFGTCTTDKKKPGSEYKSVIIYSKFIIYLQSTPSSTETQTEARINEVTHKLACTCGMWYR
jgi:hypothetical protein